MLNAAVWLGMGIFFTVGVAPAFFSSKMLALFGGETSLYSRAFAGAANIIILEKYYQWNYVCGAIAFFHLLVEWFYGKELITRFKPGLLVVICFLNIISGVFLTPQLKQFHFQKYDLKNTPTQREAAANSFKALHGISYGMNLLVVGGIGIYFYILIHQPVEQRFVIRDKIRY
ncbi:MAG: DUF4149 domain-containing protein [Verrucomicrobiia bacterium]